MHHVAMQGETTPHNIGAFIKLSHSGYTID